MEPIYCVAKKVYKSQQLVGGPLNIFSFEVLVTFE